MDIKRKNNEKKKYIKMLRKKLAMQQ